MKARTYQESLNYLLKIYDNDGVNDDEDYYPLDSTSSQEPTAGGNQNSETSSGGGSMGGILLLVALIAVGRSISFALATPTKRKIN
jgi:hypothetical protein